VSAPSRRDESFQLFEPSRADPGYGIELLNRRESAVLLPVVEDLLHEHAICRQFAAAC